MFYVATVPAANVETRPDQSRTIERFFAAIEAGDSAELEEVLTPDAVTRWPQSGERITGAQACIQVYGNYPGGSPRYRIHRIIGSQQAREPWERSVISSQLRRGSALCQGRGSPTGRALIIRSAMAMTPASGNTAAAPQPYRRPLVRESHRDDRPQPH